MFKLNKLLKLVGLVSLSVTTVAGLHAGCKWDDSKYINQSPMRVLVQQGLDSVKAEFEGDVPQEELAIHADEEGYSYLHIAAGIGNIAVLEYLLDVVGMDIEVLNRRSETPLFVAAEAGNAEVVGFLLERGANVGAQTTPFQADPRARSLSGVGRSSTALTPLHAAATECSLEVVRLLLQYDANPDATDSGNNTPLLCLSRMHLGDKEPSLNIARLLLESGANVNHVGRAGYTLLHLAVSLRCYDMVRLLIEYGAHTDISDHTENTVLDYVAESDDEKMVDILRGVEREPASCSWTRDVDLVGGIAGIAAYFFMLHHGWLEGVSML